MKIMMVNRRLLIIQKTTLPVIMRNSRINNINLDAWAIILTESHFRPFYFLLSEYLAYLFLKIFAKSRSLEISLGPAQIKAKHWKDKINLFSVLSYETAYDELIKHWKEKDILNYSIRKKISFHVGEVRTHYYAIALENKKFLLNALNSK